MLSGHLFFEPFDGVSPSVTPHRRRWRATEGLAAPASSPSDSIDPLLEALITRSGLDVRAYRDRALQRRLPSCLRAMGAVSSDRAILQLDRRPELLDRAVDAVLLGVTTFFRDDAVFRYIAEQVIPTLTAEVSGQDRPMRVWSAGCSEGHELYSVALLLEQAGCLDRAELLGTDCRSTALAAAERGRFDPSAVAAVPVSLRQRAFVTERGQLCIRPEMRRLIRWRRSDLLREIEPGPWDLVLCRNVTIYLRPESAEQVWRGIAASVRDGGFVVVGKADHPPSGIGLRRVSSSVYRKIGGTA